MADWKDKIAVVTGAAGAVGRGLSNRFADAGMKVVIADIDADVLKETEGDLRAKGATVLPVPTDIFKADQVQALADRARQEFGAVHVVCANAGVMGPYTFVWEQRPEDLQWVFGVNVFGTVNTIRAFFPAMNEQPFESHFVVTASEAGWSTNPLIGTYHASKHAVVGYVETLAKETRMINSPVKVHMLCPVGVRAPRLHDPERQRFRPSELRTSDAFKRPEGERLEERRRAGTFGNTGDEVAAAVFEGIEADRFYIFPEPRVRDIIKRAYDAQTSEQYPEPDPNFLAQLQPS
jgi:NAD(P)-dependent dehydrogenase (short-subunit alcohol dehydrogenase family)